MSEAEVVKFAKNYVTIIIRRPHAYTFAKNYNTPTGEKADIKIPGIAFVNASDHVMWTGTVQDLATSLDDVVKQCGSKPTGNKIAFKLTDVCGHATVSETDFKDRVLVLNFFASYCVPCQKEIPLLNELQDKAKQQSAAVLFVGVIMDEDVNKVTEYLRNTEFRYSVYLPDPTMKAEGAIQVPGIGKIKGMPTTVIVGKDGAVLSVTTDLLDKNELWKAVAAAINGMPIEPADAQNQAEPLGSKLRLQVDGMIRSTGAT